MSNTKSQNATAKEKNHKSFCCFVGFFFLSTALKSPQRCSLGHETGGVSNLKDVQSHKIRCLITSESPPWYLNSLTDF